MRRHLLFLGLCILGILVVSCIMPVMASYTGPCPIGTSGAPALIDPGLSSGAKCRGACGMDCPDHRCEPVDDAIIVIQDPRGICTYKHVLECSSHAGCKAHDACYDVCTESKGETSLSGPCHSACNSECY